MFFVKKIMNFFSLDARRKVLLIEAAFYLAWARVLKSMPFSRISPSLGKYMEETTKDYELSNREMLWNVSDAINLMSQYSLWENKCLVRAIAGMKMLERRKVESTLYLGTARDEAGNLIAHAWLRSGPFYITGGEERKKFVIVGKFAKQINELS
jgi:hypothetical protein